MIAAIGLRANKKQNPPDEFAGVECHRPLLAAARVTAGGR
jgi:hypothetical protein